MGVQIRPYHKKTGGDQRLVRNHKTSGHTTPTHKTLKTPISQRTDKTLDFEEMEGAPEQKKHAPRSTSTPPGKGPSL